MMSVGVLMLWAKRCGDHFANCARASGVHGVPPNSHCGNHSSSVAMLIDSRLNTPSCVTAALKRFVWPRIQFTA
jgi:hypothetical protein